MRKLEEQRKVAEEKARHENLREERARQAELRSREVARKAWEQRQREAEERIRLEKEAAAEVRSREVAERMRAEQEKAALERLRLAQLQEKQDVSRRIWANFDHTRGKSSHGDNTNQLSSTPCTEGNHPQFRWPKRNGQVNCAFCNVLRRKWAFCCPECGMFACPACQNKICIF